MNNPPPSQVYVYLESNGWGVYHVFIQRDHGHSTGELWTNPQLGLSGYTWIEAVAIQQVIDGATT